jgi:uncharacterized glyoxalase superfamily protein PhnB
MTRFYKIIPTLAVADLAGTLAYYRDVLGFTIAGQHGDDFGSVTPRAPGPPRRREPPLPEGRPAGRSGRVLHGRPGDALCRAFARAGARIRKPPTDKPWGYREFRLDDPNGHRLRFFRFRDDAA